MTGSWDGGKGSRQRPFDRKKWSEGYERAFGKKHTFFDEIRELDRILAEANKMEDRNEHPPTHH